MRGTIWTLFSAAIGCGLFLWAAVSAAAPTSAAGSTNAVNSVLTQTAPFVGLILMMAAIGALVSLAFKV